jgi:hypothetical protein
MVEEENKECNKCLQHYGITMKLGELCEWRKSHEIGTNKWRTKMEEEVTEQKLEAVKVHADIDKKIDAKIGNLKTWAIANLTGIIIVLFTLLANLYVYATKTNITN